MENLFNNNNDVADVAFGFKMYLGAKISSLVYVYCVKSLLNKSYY